MTVPAVLAIAGVVVLLVGILGGGIRAKEIEIPTVPPIGRILASAVGVVLIGMAIWLSSPQDQPPSSLTQSPAIPQPSEMVIPSTSEISKSTLPDPNKIYIIRSVLSQKVIDFDNTSIIQSEWTSQTHQEWIFEPLHGVDEGYYFIHSAQNGDCIDVRGSTVIDGGEVILFGCTGNDNQKWRIIETDSGAAYLEVKHSKKVMDLPGSNKDSGVRIIQYSYQGGENQQWTLTQLTP